ncbi:MAG: NAD(P)H-dependent oxidoreductase subunit E [Defluviitaleaceae bacterium]|nr:NAD(P)H-dependent oxidoreductase subunit E [Defluviitaleaceae bacterium]
MSQQTAEAPEIEAGGFPEIDSFINSLPDINGALIPVLHRAQEEYGYLSQEVQLHIARRLHIPASKVFGVATFYHLFTLEKKGKFRINVCLGTACFVRGSEAILHEFEKELNIKAQETTEDYLFTLDSIRCVGACGLAPVVMVNDRVYGRVKPEDVKSIVEEHMGMEG